MWLYLYFVLQKSAEVRESKQFESFILSKKDI